MAQAKKVKAMLAALKVGDEVSTTWWFIRENNQT